MSAERMPNRTPSVTAYPDGPLIVRGDVDLVDEDGRSITRSRHTVALCRCGASALKPWCDGTHKITGFSTRGESPPAE